MLFMPPHSGDADPSYLPGLLSCIMCVIKKLPLTVPVHHLRAHGGGENVTKPSNHSHRHHIDHNIIKKCSRAHAKENMKSL